MMNFISSLDIRVLETLYAYRDVQAINIFLGISEAGDTVFIVGFLACVGSLLAIRGHLASLAGLLVSSVGGAGATYVLKDIIERVRPPVEFQAYIESGFSLPSGHATIAMAFYGFCIYLVWRLVPSSLWRTVATLGLCTLIVSIAFSRLYLGVHYLSDVIAGLFLGGVFAWIGVMVVRRFEKKN